MQQQDSSPLLDGSRPAVPLSRGGTADGVHPPDGLNGLDGAAAASARGTVKWFNEKKGFGFIVDPNVPTDIFVHFSAIRADGFRTLTEGDQVEYELYRDEKGAKARNVVRV